MSGNFAWGIIAFAFVIRLLFLVGVPLEEISLPFTLSAFNDEQAHFDYVKRVAQDRTRPFQTHDISYSHPQKLADYEYYQSPLFYFLAGSIYSILPQTLKNVYSIRFCNLIIGLLTILTIGRIMLFFSLKYCFSSLVFLSLLPSMVFFNVAVTNDNLLWLLTSICVYFGLSLLSERRNIYFVGLSLSFSAAIWCKLSALALFPAILYVIFTAYEVKKFGLRIMLTLSWTMFSMFLIFPLLWQNFQYYGAFLPMSVGSGTPHNIDHIFNLKNIYLNLNFIFHSFYFPFENYWLGAFHLILFILLGIMSLFIFYSALRHYYRTISGFNDWHRKALIFLGLTLLFALIGLVYMIIRYHQAEARLTFLALPAITYLFLSGTDEVLGMYNRYLPKILAALIASSYLLFVIK